MNTLFKDLSNGGVIYALLKGDDLKYEEGTIVSVGQPRTEMPPLAPGQMPVAMPGLKTVVDVTYSINGKNYTDAVEITADAFCSKNPGALTLVSTSKETVVRELHATLKTSENYIAEAEREIPKQEKRVTECKALIAQLDTEFKERQQNEQRFSKIEEAQREQGSKLDKILALLSK